MLYLSELTYGKHTKPFLTVQLERVQQIPVRNMTSRHQALVQITFPYSSANL